MDETPAWIPILFGSVMIGMGGMILGAYLGIVPVDEGGRFLAPPAVILSLGSGLVLGGLLLWIPRSIPIRLRSLLFLAALALAAVVCNWTAFAPGMAYTSTTSIGLFRISGESNLGGRIAFGVAALIVDAFFLSELAGWVRGLFRRGD